MQPIDSLPLDFEDRRVTCCYVNATSSIQVARITNIENWYFERVVFPGQRLMFEAVPHACLEIHTGMMASAILTDTVVWASIAIEESSNSSGKLATFDSGAKGSAKSSNKTTSRVAS